MTDSPTPTPTDLRSLRHARLLTQQELAAKARVAVRTVSGAERPDAHPLRMSTRRSLLRALEIPFTEHFAIFGPLPKGSRTKPPREAEVPL